MTRELAGFVAAADGRGGCPAVIWDGPYRMRCGMGVTECARHGRFEAVPRPKAPQHPDPRDVETIEHLDALIQWHEHDAPEDEAEFFRHDGYVLTIGDLRRSRAALASRTPGEPRERQDEDDEDKIPPHGSEPSVGVRVLTDWIELPHTGIEIAQSGADPVGIWYRRAASPTVAAPPLRGDSPDSRDLELFGYAANVTTWISSSPDVPFQRFVLDPRCIIVTQGRGQQARLDLRHFEPCRCGDWSARLGIYPASAATPRAPRDPITPASVRAAEQAWACLPLTQQDAWEGRGGRYGFIADRLSAAPGEPSPATPTETGETR